MSRTAEQIAVMQAHLDKRPIEWTYIQEEKWKPFDVPDGYRWDWQNFDYRVAEERGAEAILANVPRYYLDGTGMHPVMKPLHQGAWVQIHEVIAAFESDGWKLVPPDAAPEWRYFKGPDGTMWRFSGSRREVFSPNLWRSSVATLEELEDDPHSIETDSSGNPLNPSPDRER